MSEPITTRRLEKSDVDQVLEVLRAALGEPPMLERTPELFAWKHFDNPFGKSIGLVAESGDRIVAVRTFMRWELSTPEGADVRCVRAVDTATHPDFERRGIFRRLTEEALEEAIAENVDMVFNTPNAKSGSGYLSMGWKEVGEIGALVRPTRWAFSASATEGNPPGSTSITTSRIEDRKPLGLRTPRTERYLRWRFTGHPSARYHEISVDGSVAILRNNMRNGRSELRIADVFGPQPQKAIRKARRTTRARYMATWFSPGSPERLACLRAGLVPLPGVRTLTLMARQLKELDCNVGSIAEWDLALSDLELL